ncbi:MAG: DUF6596 domain-containing protein [Cyanobacteria bacterium P01_F01_bin.53]
MDAHRAAELAARNSYGRLIAYLAVRTKDVAAAEDALGEAFLTALSTWPTRGVPAKPEAWLLVTARRKLIDRARRSQTQTKVLALLNQSGFEDDQALEQIEKLEQKQFPDDRLRLLFICAHPAIDKKLHTPLMLQTVLGLNAAQIGSAFLIAPTTMGQRLVRAKAKIKDAGIPFTLPSTQDLPQRSQAVLQAIYAAYTSGWASISEADIGGSDSHHTNLVNEAIWLAKLCVQLLPNEPEAHGLLALILYCESRRNARRSPTGEYVPLSEQNTELWSSPMIAEAETALKQAANYKKLGRFQLEAAIQSIHSQRAITQQTDWATLIQLYEGLIQLSPTIGAYLGQVAAIAQHQGPQQGLSQLERLPIKPLKNHQPYWAIKAHLLKELGNTAEAKQAYSQAIGLTQDLAVRTFLMSQSQTL